MKPRLFSVYKTKLCRAWLINVVIIALALTTGLSNALASLNMHKFHQQAQENAIAICTGSGMAYIDETAYLLTGEIEYLELSNVESTLTSDAHQGQGCLFNQVADQPTNSLHDIPLSVELISAAATIAHRESRTVQTYTYLASPSRAPPLLR